MLPFSLSAQSATDIESALKVGLPLGLGEVQWTMTAIPGSREWSSSRWPGEIGGLWGRPVVLDSWRWKDCSLHGAFWFNAPNGGGIGNVFVTTAETASAACIAQMRAELTSRFGDPLDQNIPPGPEMSDALCWRVKQEGQDGGACDASIFGNPASNAVMRFSTRSVEVAIYRPGLPLPNAVP